MMWRSWLPASHTTRLPAELVGEQREERVGGGEGVGDGGEEEVEEVAEDDQLVDRLELRGQALQGPVVAQEVVAGPGTEVGVGDDKGAHPGRSIRA